MNFKLAAEDAADEGIGVESVLHRRRRRRAGLALHGGPARRRRDRAGGEDRRRGRRARRRPRRRWRASRAGSTSARARSASRCPRARRPPAGKPIFDLPAGEMEVGIGIHGEPGRRREPLGTAREIAGDDGRGGARRPRAGPGHEGARRSSTAWAARRSSSSTCSTARSSASCASAGFEPARRLVGSYITSLEMAGASLTRARARRRADRAVGCSRPHRRAPLGSVSGEHRDHRGHRRRRHRLDAARSPPPSRRRRDHLTQLDSAIGDGDHGVNMTRGFDAVVEALAGRRRRAARPAADHSPARRWSRRSAARAGRCGAPRCAARAGRSATRRSSTGPRSPTRSTRRWPASSTSAPPSPATRRWSTRSRPPSTRCARASRAAPSLGDAIAAAAAAAEEGARATVPMQARKGRASYLGERSIGHQDPGATSTALIVRALGRAVGDAG